MTATQTEKLGFATSFVENAEEVKEIAAKVGMSVDEMNKIVREKLEYVAKLNARQEALKRETVETTALLNEGNDDLYRTVSGVLDALIAALGKGTPAAKNLQRLRSRIRMPGDQTSQPAVEPNPEATQ